MKTKSTEKVIADLRKLFEIEDTPESKKNSQEVTGSFFIYKYHFKRKKAKKILKKYFSKVKISDGYIEMLGKSLAYSMIFNIYKNDSGKKKEEKEKVKGKQKN